MLQLASYILWCYLQFPDIKFCKSHSHTLTYPSPFTLISLAFLFFLIIRLSFLPNFPSYYNKIIISPARSLSFQLISTFSAMRQVGFGLIDYPICLGSLSTHFKRFHHVIYEVFIRLFEKFSRDHLRWMGLQLENSSHSPIYRRS